MSLPAADDLFRATGSTGETAASEEVTDQPSSAPVVEPVVRRPSGRVRHDEKVTVYVTADELVDLEHARLQLRRSHGLAVDRGRLVREAVSLVLADLEAAGDDSALVRRLTEE